MVWGRASASCRIVYGNAEKRLQVWFRIECDCGNRSRAFWGGVSPGRHLWSHCNRWRIMVVRKSFGLLQKSKINPWYLNRKDAKGAKGGLGFFLIGRDSIRKRKRFWGAVLPVQVVEDSFMPAFINVTLKFSAKCVFVWFRFAPWARR